MSYIETWEAMRLVGITKKNLCLPRGGRPALTQEQAAHCRQRRQQGECLTALSREFGVSRALMYRVIYRLGAYRYRTNGKP